MGEEICMCAFIRIAKSPHGEQEGAIIALSCLPKEKGSQSFFYDWDK